MSDSELLYIRCPNCKAVFEIAPQEWSSVAGPVECSDCNQVFTGNDNRVVPQGDAEGEIAYHPEPLSSETSTPEPSTAQQNPSPDEPPIESPPVDEHVALAPLVEHIEPVSGSEVITLESSMEIDASEAPSAMDDPVESTLSSHDEGVPLDAMEGLSSSAPALDEEPLDSFASESPVLDDDDLRSSINNSFSSGPSNLKYDVLFSTSSPLANTPQPESEAVAEPETIEKAELAPAPEQQPVPPATAEAEAKPEPEPLTSDPSNDQKEAQSHTAQAIPEHSEEHRSHASRVTPESEGAQHHPHAARIISKLMRNRLAQLPKPPPLSSILRRLSIEQLWQFAALVLLLILIAQLILIATPSLLQQQGLQRWLDPLCQVVGCELPPRRDPGSLYIEQVTIGPQPNPGRGLLVEGRLGNGATFPQGWPILELRLFDGHGELIAGRALRPTEYLSGSYPDQFAAASTAAISIALLSPATEVARAELLLPAN